MQEKKGVLVEVKNISKSFGSFYALKDVSLKIERGEFFSLLGPSGCGKTTLLRIIAGFETPDEGSVTFDEKDILGLPPEKRKCNMIFQNYALFPHLSAKDNIAFPLKLKKLKKDEIEEKVKKYIRLVELEGHEHKKSEQLSGGQKQRVAIARALCCEPSVLLLDEPLSALDAKLRQNLLIELDEIHDKVGITFIYVTHDQSEALSISDHVAVFNEGEMLQYGTPYEIYESPKTKFVASFIGETNIFKATAKGSVYDKSLNEWIITLFIDDLKADVKVSDPKKCEAGEKVYFTIRPEKIRIDRGKNDLGENSFTAIVDEPVYSGYLSKFYLKLENGVIVKVFKAHTTYSDEGPEIEWKDEVSFSWRAEDGYIIRENWSEG